MKEAGMSWRFPRIFWVANGAEFCERGAYYGTFIALRTYLIRVVGLDDVQAGLVGAYMEAGFITRRHTTSGMPIPAWAYCHC